QKELDAALAYAMKGVSTDVVTIFLQHGAKLTELAFISALGKEDMSFLQVLIDNGWELDSNKFGRPAVQMAIQKEDQLRWLLEHGANPNTPSNPRRGSCANACSPLAYAASAYDTFGLELLLEYGAEMGDLALFEAINTRGKKDRVPHLKVLIDHSADVNHLTKKWGTPLQCSLQI
ncbi:hypothetical protein K458DRAFT_275134, partial [Lentithecium fluviatile CBS 122367]